MPTDLDHEAEIQELLDLLGDLRDYTVALEHASGAWFASRSYAVRPDAGNLAERLNVILGPVGEDAA